MDHSSFSQIDQQVLIECLLFAGLDATHFRRYRMSVHQGLWSSSISTTSPCAAKCRLPECDSVSYRNAEDRVH